MSGQISLQERAGLLLKEKKLTVSCAESCTGGLVTARLTEVSGSSAYVRGSVVSYTNEVKHNVLGVSQKLLDEKGAVSSEVAREMVQGALKLIGADTAVSVTGNAGPTASEGKSVGLVYIAVGDKQETEVTENNFTGTRGEIREKAVQKALSMLIEFLQTR